MIEEIGCGKINLALAITGRRDDGYHDIDTIFQSIGLHDVIRLEEADEFLLTCSNSALACDETNLAYKAYKALLPYRRGPKGVRIHIEKNIPVAAGLAGGSTDCAAVLRGLNRLWRLGLTTEELCRIGASIGADVPFCICGGTMRGRGIGEILTPLPPLPPRPVLIAHPPVPVYTGKAYSLFDTTPRLQGIAVDEAVKAVEAADFEGLEVHMGNTFEELVMPDVPMIESCRAMLLRQGLRPLMAGSGPTVFALVPPSVSAGDIYKVVAAEAKEQGIDVYISSLVEGNGEPYEENDGI